MRKLIERLRRWLRGLRPATAAARGPCAADLLLIEKNGRRLR